MRRKTFLLVLLAAAALTSCNKAESSAEEGGMTYETVEVEGCEYIQVSQDVGHAYGVYSLTHKGNCTNHGDVEIITNEENQ